MASVRTRVLWGVCLAALTFHGRACAADDVFLAVSTAWDSAYVSEGRDNIGDGGLLSASTDVSWKTFSFSAWAARGDSSDYRELNVGAGYTFKLGPIVAAGGYTRLEYGGVGEAPGDNEFSLGVSVPVPGRIECTVGGRYSTQAEGTFLEAVLRRPCETGWKGVNLNPYVLLGFDFGYSTPTYDGPNHIEAGLALDCAMSEQVTCSLYCAHSWAGGDVRRDGGRDLTWGGVRFAVTP